MCRDNWCKCAYDSHPEIDSFKGVVEPVENFIADGCVSKYGEFACQVPK